MVEVLSRRALNRATLARQLLLRRWPMSPVELVAHVVGLQAQTPHTWYVGFWSRLDGCAPEAVADLLTGREVVRIALMRSTIHLVTADDALALRPLLQPVSERGLSSNFGKHLVGLDRAELAAAGRAVLDEQPMTFSELGRALGERWPDRDKASLAQAIRAWVPLAQVPPRGVWGASGMARHAPLESWLSRPVRADYPVDEMVLRYLGAFGPASVRDVQTWSGLTRLREVTERLRPRLVTLSDANGVELFDLPDAPRPGPDVPAPARYLYDYDNLLLSHADRSRVITEEYLRQEFDVDGPMPRVVLLDGFSAATWTLATGKGTATLTVHPFARLSTADKQALTAEGAGLLTFLAAGSTHDIRFARRS
jgi:hypothetical protein